MKPPKKVRVYMHRTGKEIWLNDYKGYCEECRKGRNAYDYECGIDEM